MVVAVRDVTALNWSTWPRRLVRYMVAVGLACALAPGVASSQELEPRAYSASPVGLNFVVVGSAWLTGSVLLDPDLPISDVQADVKSLTVGGGHTFNLFGDLGLVTAVLPYALANATGSVFEQQQEARRSGLGNSLFRMSVNLKGNPAMSPAAFAAAPRRTIVGASVAVIAPTGQYDKSKLINLGTNRWAVKPEIGVSFVKGGWEGDAYGGAWFFTANRRFFPGESTRTADPMLTIQGHGSYQFRPRFWVAVNSTWYRGGSTRVDGGEPSPVLDNSRAGVTVSVPVARYSVKVAYSSGVTTRAGGDFKAVTLAWQLSWSSPRWSGLN
jgi:outer membrane putative beta-barrel porin/alpha-amylase